MEKSTKNNEYINKYILEEQRWSHKREAMVVISRVVISLALLVSGLALLELRIAGWSLIFGLPMLVFGNIFLVYTYDEVLTRRVDSHVTNKKREIDDDNLDS